MFSMVMGGKNYRLFAKSYLGFEMNQARAEYLEILTLGVPINGVFESPSHKRDFQEETRLLF